MYLHSWEGWVKAELWPYHEAPAQTWTLPTSEWPVNVRMGKNKKCHTPWNCSLPKGIESAVHNSYFKLFFVPSRARTMFSKWKLKFWFLHGTPGGYQWQFSLDPSLSVASRKNLLCKHNIWKRYFLSLKVAVVSFLARWGINTRN